MYNTNAQRDMRTAQRETRERAHRIRNARLTASSPVPFDQLPPPLFATDVDLEVFLRRNNLTYALEEYIRVQNESATVTADVLAA